MIELLRLVLWIQSLNDSFDFGLVLLLHFITNVYSHLVLHLGEILIHELFHLLGDVILLLNSDIVLPFWLFYFFLQHILLVSKVFCDLRCSHAFFKIIEAVIPNFTASVLNVACIREPHISCFVFQELSIHLQNLNMSYLLQIVTHLEDLHSSVLFELSLVKQLHLISCWSIIVDNLV